MYMFYDLSLNSIGKESLTLTFAPPLLPGLNFVDLIASQAASSHPPPNPLITLVDVQFPLSSINAST